MSEPGGGQLAGAVYRGVVLAAGGSRRFAGPLAKQLVEVGGEPAVRRAVRRALESRLAEVVVVTGNQAAAVRRAVADLPVETVHNADWRSGQSGSVRAGLARAAGGAAAVVFVPCDQPLLDAAVIDALIARHRQGTPPIVVPAFAGHRGAPVLIDAALFPELAGITGDAGARQLFGRHAVVEVELADGAPLLDFDSREQLERLLRQRAEGI